MIGDILLIIFGFALVVSGAIGVIVPFLPGTPLAWAGMLLFAYATDFSELSLKTIFVFLGFTALAEALDVLAPLLGAKKYKASAYGMIGSFLGLLFGVMMMGPIGIVLGPFVGALAGEMLRGREPEEAMQSAKGTVIGFLAGSAIKLALIFVMLGFMIWSLIL
jgi:uncharacterized protein YqgC (DUF456 family)